MADNEKWFYVGSKRLKEIAGYIKEQFNKRQRSIDTINAELDGCHLSYVDGKFYIHHGDVVKRIGSEGTATQEQVLEGASFDSLEYDGTVEGSMPNNGAVNVSYRSNWKVAQAYNIPKGYHDGDGVVNILNNIDVGGQIYIWNQVRGNSTSWATTSGGACVFNSNVFTRSGTTGTFTYNGPANTTFTVYCTAISSRDNVATDTPYRCYARILKNGSAVATANSTSSNNWANQSATVTLNPGDTITFQYHVSSSSLVTVFHVYK